MILASGRTPDKHIGIYIYMNTLSKLTWRKITRFWEIHLPSFFFHYLPNLQSIIFFCIYRLISGGVVGSSSGLGILGVGLPRKNFQLPPQSPGMETGDIFLELREKRPAMG